MKIKTLGDFAKGVPDALFGEYDTPLAARTNLYKAMSYYMDAAMRFAEDGTDMGRTEYMQATGRFLDGLMADARAHLDRGKYTYLLTHSIEEPSDGGYEFNGGDLMDAINKLWGSEDMFMFRLSGNLPASYVKAIVGLKGQVRFTGYTLQQILNNYRKVK